MTRLPVGTLSLLVGAHQVALHPLFVAAAWTRLYGVPRDPRLWVAFVVHDWGYWGLSEMDGEAGERHVEFGARVMRDLFGPEWHDLCLLHSRFYARALGRTPSKLCAADKLAMALEPAWLYLPRVLASGEAWEYLHEFAFGKYREGGRVDITHEEIQARRLTLRTVRALLAWHTYTRCFLRQWAHDYVQRHDGVPS